MGAILVYAINNYQSFKDLENWLTEVKANSDPMCSIILLGNKADTAEDERQVSTEQGQKFANEHNLKFFEVSAIKNLHLFETAIESLMTQIADKYNYMLEQFNRQQEQRRLLGDQ